VLSPDSSSITYSAGSLSCVSEWAVGNVINFVLDMRAAGAAVTRVSVNGARVRELHESCLSSVLLSISVEAADCGIIEQWHAAPYVVRDEYTQQQCSFPISATFFTIFYTDKGV
jgi:hypothetical protein